MIYPENIEQKIGFERIKQSVMSYCLSQMGEDLVSEMSFQTDFNQIKTALLKVNEFRTILMMGESFPASNYFDLREAIERLTIEGTTISQEELFDFASTFNTLADIEAFFTESRISKYPVLSDLRSMICFSPEIAREAWRIIDEKGHVRDSASERLGTIRREYRKLISGSRDRIYQVLQHARKNGWTREDAEVTVRNGRVVIPLHSSHKRSIKGFIHDESASGQTCYLEPIEMFENNNRIKELEVEEDQEIRRILFDYVQILRPEREALDMAWQLLGELDFVRAKARFGIEENAHVPALLDEQIINWRQAVHPLLAMSHRAKKREVISQDILLNAEQRVLIISGPNAGGKSVMLKTVALNQFMLQSGLPITINPSSECGIFQKIFIDIGDEQSIDNDLSTYSSHLSNIRFFLQNADNQTIVLIDEFGTGTEPDLGGAIASASLEHLYQKGVFAVVTTHYAQLKVLADQLPFVYNGAMMFDTKNLSPLFKFKPGTPGSSFAFEIARSIGLDEIVLQKAAEIVGEEKINFDFQLQDLENEREMLIAKRKEFEQADDILAEMISKYNALLSGIKTRERDIVHKARLEAKGIIDGANRAIENAIGTIREAGANKDVTVKMRKKVEATKQQIIEDIQKDAKAVEAEFKELQKSETVASGIKLLDGIPIAGDYVVVRGQTAIGTVDSVKKSKAVVDFDSLKMIVALENLVRAEPPKGRKSRPTGGMNSVMSDINDRVAAFSPNIDIRGKRAEEALQIVENLIDEAVLTGNKYLEILHGKGDGILRMVLREMLQKNSSVSTFRDAPLELGGSGKTIVNLK